MAGRKVHLVLLLLAVGCQQVSVSAQKPAPTVEEVVTEAEVDTQLRINRDALLRGASEEIRTDAAAIMLFSDNPLARRVLLNALKQSENSVARAAVCAALSRTRRTGRTVMDKGEFIEPLIEVIRTEDSAVAKLSAEATLLFEYDELSTHLETLVSDKSVPVRARLNAIYALKLQLDMRAISYLMNLLDDDEQQVAQAAEEALRSLGIPTAKSSEARKRIIAELRQKGIERFQQEWLVLQEAHVSELERKLERMRKLYLGALDTIYGGIKDDSAKGAFLVGHLGSLDAAVRLWSLEKVSQWRLGTQSKLPADLGPILVGMISDENGEVRLRTARLLSLMGELSSAERLLDRLNVEQDEEVKLELFIALGGACHYALLPTSGVQLAPEIRGATLQWAASYLADENTRPSQRGAEVIAKLLEADGLAAEGVGRYLGLLAERYKRTKDADGGGLRGELLGVMAGLCAQSSYKTEAARQFGPLFEKSLADDADLVRQAAVDGLANIDKTRALKLVRKDFTNDRSIVIRKKIIALAGEVGSKEDLVWLFEKIGANSESGPAWQAMLRIFDGSDCVVVGAWLSRFESRRAAGQLSDEQWGSFLELAENKAAAENKTKMLNAVKKHLASVYSSGGQYERAAEYIGSLLQSAETPEQKDEMLDMLVDVFLRWGNHRAVGQIVANRLLEKDLGADDIVVRCIEQFFANPASGVDPGEVLEVLEKIEAGENRPMWKAQIKAWVEHVRGAKVSVEVGKAGE